MNDWKRKLLRQIADFLDAPRMDRLEFLRSPLRLLSLPYRGVVEFRRLAYRFMEKETFHCRVISIGSISFGGSGKTPVTLELASRAERSGHRAAIVTSGYGGNRKAQPILVFDGKKILSTVGAAGDEAVMMARRLNRQGMSCLVIADRIRPRAIRLALANGCDLVLLDDAFHCLNIRKDLDIILLRPQDVSPFQALIPAGSLREPLDSIRYADILWLCDFPKENDSPPRKALAWIEPHGSIIESRSAIARIYTYPEMKEVSLHSLSASRFLAFAGLARPQAFFDRLKEKSIPVGCEMAFPDHFLYGKSDLRELERTALHQGCDALITTEKDIVKVPSDWESRIPLYMTELSIELARVSLAAPLQTGILADLKIVDV